MSEQVIVQDDSNTTPVGVTPSSRPKPLTFKTHIHNLLKQTQVGFNLAGVTCEQLDVSLKIMLEKISDQARILTRDNKHQTITVKEVSAAIELMFPATFNQMALAKCREAVEKYSNTFYNKDGDQSRAKANRAGIHFPPHICEKYLRQHNSSSLSVSETAPVFLAALLDVISTRVLTSAKEKAAEGKKKTINTRHLFLGIHLDPELSVIFNNFGVHIVGGGVVPGIHDKLIPDADKKKKLANKRRKTRSADATANHKALPGTKSLKKIKSLQKTNELLIKREPFRRFLKQQINTISENTPNFAGNVLNTVQYYVEEKTIEMLKDALDLMIHAKRTTLKPKDILLCLAHHYKHDNQPNFEVKSYDELVADSIRRLAARAGTKTIEKECLPIIREFILKRCLDIILPAIVLMNYHSVKTLSIDIIHRAASVNGVYIPLESKIRRKKRNNTSPVGENAGDDGGDDEDDGEDAVDEGEDDEANQVQMVEAEGDD